MKKIDVLEVGKYALLGTSLFLIYKLFRGTGLIKTASEEADENKVKDIDAGKFEPLSPNLWKTLKSKYPKNGVMLLKQSETNKYIYDIFRSSVPLLPANKDRIFGVFNQLKYQSQVSWIADQFQKKYNKDLNTFLNIGYGRAFNDDDKKRLYNIISALPLGIQDLKTKKIIL